jgi:integrase
MAKAPEIQPRKRGSGYIYKRKNSSNWWICFYFRGKARRESANTSDRAKAEKRLDQRVRAVRNDQDGIVTFVPNAHKVFVDELLDALEKHYRLNGGRGLPQFKSHVKPIRAAFGDMRAVNVTAKVVDDYIDDRLAGDKKAGIRPKAPATVNRETQLLGQAFSLGIERKQILTAPRIRHLPERNVRQGFFEPAEFEAVVSRLPEYLRDYAKFAFLCAWRKGQLASLTWADVDRDAGVVIARAKHVKNGTAHKIVLEDDLAAIIERRWLAREYKTPEGNSALSQYVFHLDGQRIGDFRKSWASACKAAGFVKPKLDDDGNPVTITGEDGNKETVMVHSKVFHDFRRSGVRNMVRSGVREGVAMAISGHKTRAVFERYNITSEDDLRQAVKQTAEHVRVQQARAKVVAISQHRK